MKHLEHCHKKTSRTLGMGHKAERQERTCRIAALHWEAHCDAVSYGERDTCVEVEEALGQVESPRE